MTDKARLRAAALAARDAIPDRAARSLALCGHLTGWLHDRHPEAVLAGYWPIRSEVDSRPALPVHAGPTCLPVVVAPGASLLFRHWRVGDALEPGLFGTLHPLSSAKVIRPEVVLVPLLGFDRHGARLGYGGGFYDRTLETLRHQGPVVAVGLGFAAQESAALPTGAHDQPLDLLVTEDGIIQPAA